ncbi:hypothetical protein J22TS3_16010 [Paenibacillus sp. J22TS3]|nr:hypothetical protein J22TS3_16010 [Paenibacillus sp. J22TS3]
MQKLKYKSKAEIKSRGQIKTKSKPNQNQIKTKSKPIKKAPGLSKVHPLE